jgi:dihydroxyacetone kinase-like predicted kinase
MCKKNVVVLKTKSEPQGIAAAVAYDPERPVDENVERMKKAVLSVKTGQVTNAVRDTKINGSRIKEGDIIGIADGDIVANGGDLDKVVKELLAKLADDDSEIVTFYYGDKISQDEAESLLEDVQEGFPALDFELIYGGQPVYQYLISVE